MGLNALDITDEDRAAYRGRSRDVDYNAIGELHYLGNYVRDIPSNLTRMMENAHDWEHLPFVHPTSFTAIAPVETGRWGWRCKTTLPNNGGDQLIELLVDNDNYYWATTVVEGAGQGTQIHTQASARDEGGITVDVRFYLPQSPETDEQGGMILGYLQAQYATLYDEDEALMLGRQKALDERKALRAGDAPSLTSLGLEDTLDRGKVHACIVNDARVLVRFIDDKWVAHAARCPHALGPLDDSEPDAHGRLECPWHGYRFDLKSGEEAQKRCGSLHIYRTEVWGGELYITTG